MVEAKKYLDEIIKHRRELHKIPEIGLDLPKTKAYIKEVLKSYGLNPIEVGHGLVVDFGNPPFIAVRADMDALPLTEKNDVPYKSQHEGAMHACGHDAHSAVLLTLAKVLSEKEINGGIRLIFQPGEEGFFGAVDMIKNGALENVETIIGAHVGNILQNAPEGAVISRRGPFMAASDEIKLKFVGKGGHGSTPHNTLDPIVAAAHYITAVYTFRSREINQTHPTTITIASVNSGTTHNIIPQDAELSGTVRTFDENDRKFIASRLEEIADSIAAMFRMESDFEYIWGYDATINAPDVVEDIEKVCSKLGIKYIEAKEPVMGSEDFSYYLKETVGAYFFVNTANKEKGITAPNHSPFFDIDEEKLWIPLAVFLEFLKDKKRFKDA